VLTRALRGASAVGGAIGLAFAIAAQTPPELTPQQIREDFAVFCSEVRSTYAYFDQKATRWDLVASAYEADVDRVRTRQQLVAVLEQAIAELYDDHAHLNVNTASSFKLVPSGADLWVEWVGSAATVTEVREESSAERAGIRRGAVVLSINGTPVDRAVAQVFPRTVPKGDLGARNWALRRVLAGRHGEDRRIEVDQGGGRQVFDLPQTSLTQERSRITYRRLDRHVGYIRFGDSLGDAATVQEFDRALESLRDTRGLVIDLRETPSGGNSTVARGILGRFVPEEVGYQKHTLPSEESATGIRRSWIELVSPRGPFRYQNRVAVLVGRWTGSMGEGMAIGFDAVIRATTVGGPMAQLLGATCRIELPNSKIGVNLPAERLAHVNGTPREAFRPAIPAFASPGNEDAVLAAGVGAVLGRGGKPGA
jgi:carboxyl-terminal processing protease